MMDKSTAVLLVMIYLIMGFGVIKAVRRIEKMYVEEFVGLMIVWLFWPLVPVIWAFASFKED